MQNTEPNTQPNTKKEDNHVINFNESMGEISNVALIVKEITGLDGWPSEEFRFTTEQAAEFQDRMARLIP